MKCILLSRNGSVYAGAPRALVCNNCEPTHNIHYQRTFPLYRFAELEDNHNSPSAAAAFIIPATNAKKHILPLPRLARGSPSFDPSLRVAVQPSNRLNCFLVSSLPRQSETKLIESPGTRLGGKRVKRKKERKKRNEILEKAGTHGRAASKREIFEISGSRAPS